MTTTVTIEVPKGADYVAEVIIRTEAGVVCKHVRPGETLTEYVYGERYIDLIEEIPNC